MTETNIEQIIAVVGIQPCQLLTGFAEVFGIRNSQLSCVFRIR